MSPFVGIRCILVCNQSQSSKRSIFTGFLTHQLPSQCGLTKPALLHTGHISNSAILSIIV